MLEKTIRAVEEFVRKYSRTPEQAQQMRQDLAALLIVAVTEATDHMFKNRGSDPEHT